MKEKKFAHVIEELRDTEDIKIATLNEIKNK